METNKQETLLTPWRERPVAQVAARIGRSKSHIWRVIHGQRKPGRDLAAVLSAMGFKTEVV